MSRIRIGRGKLGFWFETDTLSDDQYRQALAIGVRELIKKGKLNPVVLPSSNTVAKSPRDKMSQ